MFDLGNQGWYAKLWVAGSIPAGHIFKIFVYLHPFLSHYKLQLPTEKELREFIAQDVKTIEEKRADN